MRHHIEMNNPLNDPAIIEDEYEVCVQLGMEGEYSNWGPCPPHLVEALRNSDAHCLRKKLSK